MLAKSLHLTVWASAQVLIDAQEVLWVQARLADGAGIGIYPRHAPLLGETVAAPIRYADQEGEHALDLEAGILQVTRDRVTIFSDQSDGGLSGQPQHENGVPFDRLARELVAALKAQPEAAAVSDDETGP